MESSLLTVSRVCMLFYVYKVTEFGSILWHVSLKETTRLYSVIVNFTNKNDLQDNRKAVR